MKPVKIRKSNSVKYALISTPDGNFTSWKEYDRYLVLLGMQNKGLIYGLQKHVTFTLLDAVYIYKYERKALKTKTKKVKKKICAEAAVAFDASFIYYNKKGNIRVELVKDRKAYKDPVYIIKRKLIRYLHQIVVIEN